MSCCSVKNSFRVSKERYRNSTAPLNVLLGKPLWQGDTVIMSIILYYNTYISLNASSDACLFQLHKNLFAILDY